MALGPDTPPVRGRQRRSDNDGGSPCVWRQTLRPHRQGELDSLCGIYAIINALRWAAGPEVITARITTGLFRFLTDQAIREQGNLGLCSRGIGLLHQRQLIKRTIVHLAREHRLRFAYDLKPTESLASLGDPSVSSAIPIADHEAILLNLSYTEWHWSVLQAVAGDKLKLFDSVGWRTLPRGRVMFGTSFVLRFLGRIPRKAPRLSRKVRATGGAPLVSLILVADNPGSKTGTHPNGLTGSAPDRTNAPRDEKDLN